VRVYLIDTNIAYKVPLRTKKIDMTPIRLEGDDEDEDGGGEGDEDEDEDEESTPVPRSKRHVTRYVFLLGFHPIPQKAFTYTYFALHPRCVRKTTAKSAPMKPKSRQREVDKGQDDDDDDDGSGASEPADSIMDSGSEEEADNEVDGMLGE
jgi:hypothetical protein